MVEAAIGALLSYARSHGLLDEEDVAYVRNRILEVLRIDSYELAAEDPDPDSAERNIDELLRPLLDDASARGLIEPDTITQRDLWDTAIMGCFVDFPSRINSQFWAEHRTDPRAATALLHSISVASNYIRVSRTDANPSWLHPSRYGDLEITINISKPEKDPRDIAAAAATSSTSVGYPTCLLCRQNEGYAGRSDHPARQNLRMVPIELTSEPWFLQYSPYRYYSEHCIVLSDVHRPMLIDNPGLRRLAEFTALFPHYLIGSNADLPIVGGSILTHDHFQGGSHRFPMERAATLANWTHGDVGIEVLDWPLSTIVLTGPEDRVIDDACEILAAWRDYSDPSFDVFACTADTPHNTITPIARRVGQDLRMYLVLRNNRTSDQHPGGIFHPHAQIHPIKQENIGLIEVMGLAVLPGRLLTELDAVADAFLNHSALPEDCAKHQPMLDEMRATGSVADHDEAEAITRRFAGEYFTTGLEHCGVFGSDAASGFERFLRTLGWL